MNEMNVWVTNQPELGHRTGSHVVEHWSKDKAKSMLIYRRSRAKLVRRAFVKVAWPVSDHLQIAAGVATLNLEKKKDIVVFLIVS